MKYRIFKGNGLKILRGAFLSWAILFVISCEFFTYVEPPYREDHIPGNDYPVSLVNAPSVPGGFSAVSGGADRINLSWTPSTHSDYSSAQLYYEICQSIGSSGCNTFNPQYTTGSGSLSYTAMGLFSGTTYYFRIRAVDPAGVAGESSTQASAVTDLGSAIFAPIYTPAAGTYSATQSVVISSATSGATKCFTTDGVTAPACNASAQCSVGNTYSTPVTVSASLTIKAIACLTGYQPSSVTTGNYVIVPPGLTFTNGDGKAELTGVPTLNIGSITGSTGGAVQITVPVDTDTGYVLVKFVNRATGTQTGVQPITLTPGTAQSGMATVNVSAGLFPTGSFVYVYVMMGISNVDVLTNGTGTIYEIVQGSAATTYNKKFVVTNNAGLPTDTGVTATVLVIN